MSLHVFICSSLDDCCTGLQNCFFVHLLRAVDSPANDAANFTWQGVFTAVQSCSTLPSVALQWHSPSPAPTMHFRVINLNTCKREMSHFLQHCFLLFSAPTLRGFLLDRRLSLFRNLNKTDLGCLYVSESIGEAIQASDKLLNNDFLSWFSVLYMQN